MRYVRTLRRCLIQGLIVVGIIIDEITRVNIKTEKMTGALNIGESCRIKIHAIKSERQGDALSKV